MAERCLRGLMWHTAMVKKGGGDVETVMGKGVGGGKR